MGKVNETVRIEAPIDDVWAILADFGGIAKWHPLLKSSRLLGTPNGGLEAERRCEIKPRGYTMERVLKWDPGAGYAWTIFETDMPMKQATNRFSLRADGIATIAAMDMDYEMKGGLLGRIMDRLMANAKMHEAARATLAGLKARAEGTAGAPTGAPDDAGASAG